jgi:undecaprenyl pyrophosphate phosphatase UppP
LQGFRKETAMDFIITIIYYILVGLISVVLIYNFIKTKEWEKEVLYIIVLIPFLLRLFMLK